MKDTFLDFCLETLLIQGEISKLLECFDRESVRERLLNNNSSRDEEKRKRCVVCKMNAEKNYRCSR